MKEKNSSIFLMVSMVLIGFLGGIVGELWVNSFLLPDPYLKFKSYSDLSARIDELVSNQGIDNSISSRDKILTEAIVKSRPALVDVFRFRDLSKLPNTSFLPGDWLGFGAIVTSDGWVVASRETVKNSGDFLLRLANGQLVKVEKVVLPKDSEVSFLKIERVGLDVAGFALRRNLVDGAELMVFDNAGATINGVQNKNFNEVFLDKDFLHSSEKFYRQILLSGEGSKIVGSPVFSLQGTLVGFVANGGKTVWPVENFLPMMKAVSKNQEWQKPYLGLKFVDLTEFVNPNFPDKKGVKIAVDGVAVNSPAFGKILAGDIIIRVENEELNENKSLPEILADYSTGTTLKFWVKRGGEEKEIQVEVK
ncbi:MAG: S1C family serine protease [Patescibacteria group bacterium]